ncbi:DUF5337 domain-containing protein [Litoreibacter roseus]|uniref:DUF5337 domain-containing protein n=1 Tax=Litoreibacter roseus TaxID=2601869 RepID=A0A6N6JKJ7_9RHOB|nr:DUF5337 domain-containing protein [Litoreibacter roseus]GFE65798.1 hypothetical protein KIN_28720 [Litoreibacter roseus]
MASDKEDQQARAGRRVALFLAGVGVFWIIAIWAGEALNLSHRMRALFDLFALAGFGWGLWMVFDLWRNRQGQ